MNTPHNGTGASGEYLRSAVMSATPEQLHLMLYDGAIRFTRQARDALQSRNLETSCEKLIRAQRIVVELQRGLRPEHNPDLCRQLAGLYDFVYHRLVEANLRHEPALLDDALKILEHQRDTWQLLLQRVQTASETRQPPASDEPPPDRSAIGQGRTPPVRMVPSRNRTGPARSVDSLPQPTISLEC